METTAEAIEATIGRLRDSSDHTISLPKGVAVGLIVGIEDALWQLNYLRERATTKKTKAVTQSAIANLIGPRDRLLRVVRGEPQ